MCLFIIYHQVWLNNMIFPVFSLRFHTSTIDWSYSSLIELAYFEEFLKVRKLFCILYEWVSLISLNLVWIFQNNLLEVFPLDRVVWYFIRCSHSFFFSGWSLGGICRCLWLKLHTCKLHLNGFDISSCLSICCW